MRKPLEFTSHPVPYEDARELGVFRAVVKHVVDGDTFDAFVDLGMGQYAYETFRLLDFDAPEMVGADQVRARACKERVVDLVGGHHVLIQTWKDRESFGRWVAKVLFLSSGAWVSLADALQAEGWTK